MAFVEAGVHGLISLWVTRFLCALRILLDECDGVSEIDVSRGRL